MDSNELKRQNAVDYLYYGAARYGVRPISKYSLDPSPSDLTANESWFEDRPFIIPKLAKNPVPYKPKSDSSHSEEQLKQLRRDSLL